MHCFLSPQLYPSNDLLLYANNNSTEHYHIECYSVQYPEENSADMRLSFTVVFLFPLLLLSRCSSSTAQRSPKKGVVIPNWPAHYCYDWDNMEEHIRYSVYFRAGYEQEVLQSQEKASSLDSLTALN